jgi:YHS domain-containing protein
VIVGPIIAVLSFVCSVGNVPIAAVLWSGGISFGGVVAFIFADLIVVPILLIYRKYYGNAFALRITALMFVTIVLAALLVDLLFGAAGLIPHARPSRGEIFEQVGLNFTLIANALSLSVFAALFALTMRRGATDPVCGMQVDRAKAVCAELADERHYFCSEHCLRKFQTDRLHAVGPAR